MSAAGRRDRRGVAAPRNVRAGSLWRARRTGVLREVTWSDPRAQRCRWKRVERMSDHVAGVWPEEGECSWGSLKASCQYAGDLHLRGQINRKGAGSHGTGARSGH